MRKLLLFLFCLVGILGIQAETVLDFTDWKFPGAWTGSSYANKTITFDQAVVEMTASHQTSTVSDCPVTKGSPITVTFNDGYTFSHVVLNLKQWSSKAQTVTLSTSVDGTNFIPTDEKSSTFKLEADITEDVKAIRFTFNSTSNQVGISSIVLSNSSGISTLSEPEITIGDGEFTISSVENGEVYYCVNKNATATAEECTTLYNGAVPFETAYGTYYVHAFAKATDTDSYKDSGVVDAKYEILDPNVIQDVLTAEMLDTDKSGTYVYGTYVSPRTGIEFVYDVAKDSNGYLQFNDTGNRGIIVTKNPDNYTVKSVEIEWGRTDKVFSVYGKNSMYTLPDNPALKNVAVDLYNAKTQGALIKDYSASGVDDVESLGYKALGFRAKSGAVYIKSIKIIYVEGQPEKQVYTPLFAGQSYNLTVGDNVELDLGDEYPASIRYDFTEGGNNYASISTIDNTTVLYANAIGNTTLVAEWDEDDTWQAGRATATVSIEGTRISTPVISYDLGADTYHIACGDINAHDFRIMYAQIPATKAEPEYADWVEYDGNAIEKKEEAGDWKLWAYIRSLDAAYYDSFSTFVEYTVESETPELPQLEAPVISEDEDVIIVTNGVDETIGTLVYSNVLKGEEPNWDFYTAAFVKPSVPGTYVFSAQVWANDNNQYADSEIESIEYTIEEVVVPGDDVVYTLVKDVADLKDGDKIIIASSTEYNKAISITQNNNNRAAADVVIKDEKITNPAADVQVLTLNIVDDTKYTFFDENVQGYLYAAGGGGTSKNNYLKTSATITDDSKANIEINANTCAAQIKFTGTANRNILRYNNSNKCFSCYASGQEDVYIYKLVVNEPEIEAVDATDIAEALDLGGIDDSVEEGDLLVSVSNFKIVAPLHVFATEGSSVYVADNKGGFARIDNVSADMETDKEISNAIVKYVEDYDTGLVYFRYVGHETGVNAAAAQHKEVALADIKENLAEHTHNYLKVMHVYYDADKSAIYNEKAEEETPAEVMRRAPEYINEMVIDNSRLKDNAGVALKSGYTSIYGYVEHVNNTPTFIALTADEVVTGIDAVIAEDGVQVVNGVIVAPADSEVFTIGGLRVSVSGRQTPGLYIVRLNNGNAVKVIVK